MGALYYKWNCHLIKNKRERKKIQLNQVQEDIEIEMQLIDNSLPT